MEVPLSYVSKILSLYAMYFFFNPIIYTSDLPGNLFKLGSSCSGYACFFLQGQNSEVEMGVKHMQLRILSLFHTLHSAQETILIQRYSPNSDLVYSFITFLADSFFQILMLRILDTCFGNTLAILTCNSFINTNLVYATLFMCLCL